MTDKCPSRYGRKFTLSPTTKVNVKGVLKDFILQKRRVLSFERQLSEDSSDSSHSETFLSLPSSSSFMATHSKGPFDSSEPSSRTSCLGDSLFSASPLLFQPPSGASEKTLQSLKDSILHRSLPSRPTVRDDNQHFFTDNPRFISLHLQPHTKSPRQASQLVGIGWDDRFTLHRCTCARPELHPENPFRLSALKEQLPICGAFGPQLVKTYPAEYVQWQDLLRCHNFNESFHAPVTAEEIIVEENHRRVISRIVDHQPKQLFALPCGGVGLDVDTFWNPQYSAQVASLAAGLVTKMALDLCRGKIRSGFALVRPPGHHAEVGKPLGYCIYNSVAIAAKRLLHRESEDEFEPVKRILILDWDIHHANSTADMFYDSEEVLVISMHRHDHGTFFPGTGAMENIGGSPAASGRGKHFNVNIPFSSSHHVSDVDYYAAFTNVVLPIVLEFQPQFAFISAGFSATAGHPHQLGGFALSPALFAWMTEIMCRNVSEGRVLMVLEGGYHPTTLCECVLACLRTLIVCAHSETTADSETLSGCEVVRWCRSLIPNLPLAVLEEPIPEETLLMVQQVLLLHGKYWTSLNSQLHLITKQQTSLLLRKRFQQSLQMDTDTSHSNKTPSPRDESTQSMTNSAFVSKSHYSSA